MIRIKNSSNTQIVKTSKNIPSNYLKWKPDNNINVAIFSIRPTRCIYFKTKKFTPEELGLI